MEQPYPFTVREVRRADLMEWMRLRARMWPELSMEEHRKQMEGVYDNADDFYKVFVADTGPHGLAAFLEASIGEYQGTDSRIRVVQIEGFHVDAELADATASADLHRAAERWGRELGCTEVAAGRPADDPVIKDYLRSGYRVHTTTVKVVKPLA